MFCYFNLLFHLTLIWGSLAVDYSVTPIPHADCPAIDDINHAVMLPYPQDCNKYYSCLKGNAYLQQCPNNMHWSTITYRCDYPDVAKCQTTLLPIPANTINTLTASLTGEIFYQLHPNDCAKYYKCQVFSCPTNYYWNSFMQKCDFPHNAQCPFQKGVSNTAALIPAYPMHSISVDTENNLGEIYLQHYPNDCSKFLQCQSMLCPANYHWNIRTQQCDLPQLAQCPLQPQFPQVHETSTASVPTAFTAPPTPAVTTHSQENSSIECLDCAKTCDDYRHHYLPHPNDCHKFIQCNGWSFIHNCPDNLFWNAKLNTCDRICVAN